MRIGAGRAVAAVVGSALLGLGCHPRPLALGVSVHYVSRGLAADYARFGATYVRLDLPWDECERSPGQYDFGEYKAAADALAEQGLKPIFVLAYGNDLYGGGPPVSDEARAAYVRYARVASGAFPAATWEIWNEPNTEEFWPGSRAPEPIAYAALVAASARAIKAASPDARVYAGAMGGDTLDEAWVEGFMATGVLARDVDALSIHPYWAPNPDQMTHALERLRALMRAHGPELPIVVSEYGVPSARSGVGETGQAEHMAAMLRAAADAGVDTWIIYTWRDGDGSQGEADSFGLKRHDGHDKPVVQAVQQVLAERR